MKQKPARLTQKQAFFRKSIGATIMAAFSALILGTVLLMALFSYQFTRDEVQSNAMDYTQQLIMQVNADIDFYVEYIKDIMDIIVRNSSVSSYLIQGRDAPEGVRERVAEQLANAKSIRREISSIALITVDGRAVFSDASFTLNPYSFYENAAWYQDALNSPSEVYISSSHVQNIIEGEYDWVVTFSLAVPGPRGMPAAVLLIDLNYEVINDICARIELGNRGYIFLLDSRGDILWHPAQQLIYSNLKQENVGEVFALGNGRKLIGSGSDARLYVAGRSSLTGWTAVGVAYLEELLQNQESLNRFYLAVCLISVVIAVFVAALISRAITDPIRRLAYTMARVETGDLGIRCDVKSANEVGRLSENFNHMISKMQALMEQLVHNEEQKRKSELKALQAQIKPHFLYNTLDSIIWMAHAGKNSEVADMTVALASMLRTSIGSGNEMIPLKEEMEQVSNYLIIQKLRYNEKLRYELDMSPETASFTVPKLILQPLVENAIYHGIKVKDEGGFVRIASMEEDGKLLITVEDDGVGIDKEALANIHCQKQGDAHSTKIGIYNVNERIRFHYGQDYGLKYFSEIDKGTLVMLVLPATGV